MNFWIGRLLCALGWHDYGKDTHVVNCRRCGGQQ
jgi:hypothetical protein